MSAHWRGRNVRVDVRWGAADPERIRSYAAELVALAPDVIVATGSAIVGSLLQATRAVPCPTSRYSAMSLPKSAGWLSRRGETPRLSQITDHRNFICDRSSEFHRNER